MSKHTTELLAAIRASVKPYDQAAAAAALVAVACEILRSAGAPAGSVCWTVHQIARDQFFPPKRKA